MSDPRPLVRGTGPGLVSHHFGSTSCIFCSFPKNCLLRGVASLCVQASALLFGVVCLVYSHCSSIACILSTVHRSQDTVSLETSTEGAIHWDVTQTGQEAQGETRRKLRILRRRNQTVKRDLESALWSAVILDSKLHRGAHGPRSQTLGAQGPRPFPTSRLYYPSGEQNGPPFPMQGPVPGSQSPALTGEGDEGFLGAELM